MIPFFANVYFSSWTKICSKRILSGVSQQLWLHVYTKTLPNSMGTEYSLENFKIGIKVGNIWISHIISPAQFWHFGLKLSGSADISSGDASREYLKCDNVSISGDFRTTKNVTLKVDQDDPVQLLGNYETLHHHALEHLFHIFPRHRPQHLHHLEIYFLGWWGLFWLL